MPEDKNKIGDKEVKVEESTDRKSKICMHLVVEESGRVKVGSECGGFPLDLMESMPNLLSAMVSVAVEHMMIAQNGGRELSKGERLEMKGMVPIVLTRAADEALKLINSAKIKNIIIPGR